MGMDGWRRNVAAIVNFSSSISQNPYHCESAGDEGCVKKEGGKCYIGV
jgi:hypothetical protein